MKWQFDGHFAMILRKLKVLNIFLNRHLGNLITPLMSVNYVLTSKLTVFTTLET